MGHPALSPDGNTLYFVSDMPGGYGETDIYFCKRTGDAWSDPVNLGSEVNTPGKELFPFIAADGALYFASDGLPGFGGLDLYVTTKITTGWTRPQNMGLPINSSYDDLSLVMTGEPGMGLFSSNRPGGVGSDDIYGFHKLDIKTPEPPAMTVVSHPPDPIPVQSGTTDTLVENRAYRLENIFYNFDKWDIRNDARPSLDRLVSIMKQYPIDVELGSHTDCRGSESYNLVLSQKRAESAVGYIISKGISPGRLKAKGYGKSQPANGCNCTAGKECTDAVYQYNRRTEFRIIEKHSK